MYLFLVYILFCVNVFFVRHLFEYCSEIHSYLVIARCDSYFFKILISRFLIICMFVRYGKVL